MAETRLRAGVVSFWLANAPGIARISPEFGIGAEERI